ncbi:hypothetical protein J5226_24140 [Lysobacter sp. K5869]|uniref:hypothetical protein n=1 Tax=Lysobacter sp. K5869 TaxID=2820808 RepID=UPI001C062A9D|nr:hypothetical protein [Lysobacter sp. K5869]QWP76629.1 hypothetical protein J5226_24140 [Lysobacter sp. K5869]
MPDRPPLSPGLPPSGNAPAAWADAFAALPAETPPADGWARVAARLPERRAAAEFVAPKAAAPRAPARWRWAMAAMLAAALPLGVWLSLRAPRPAADALPPAPLAQESAAQRGPRVATVPSSQANEAPAADAGGKPRTERAAPDAAAPNAADNERRIARAVTSPAPEAAPKDPPRRLDTRVLPAAASNAADDTRLTAQLRDLQAESAQLEALVAAARDDRVASASAAVMSAGLDQRLRLIDAALIDAALPADARVALWRERVDSLRSLAGVESTQRWYAARGERYDGALVRVD